MATTMTLEQLEATAAQLPLQQQLRLLSDISDRLSRLQLTARQPGDGRKRHEYAARVETWLADCDKVAEQIEGDFDSAEDLREIREEGAGRL